MIGFNDDVVRGKKKKTDHKDPNKGPWTVYVRKPSGTTFPLPSAIPGNRISRCKEKILKAKGIPIDEQRLSFQKVPLRDEKTLVGSGVRNGDTIDLGPMVVGVRTRKGKVFTFEVDPDETVETLKRRVEKRQGTPPADEQRLYFKGTKLTDGKPLTEFGIQHNARIDLGDLYLVDGGEVIDVGNNLPKAGSVLDVAPLIEVTTPDKTKVKVPLLPQMKFDDIKDIVTQKTGSPPDANNRVFFLDNDGNEIDDSVPVDKAGIEPGSLLEMCSDSTLTLVPMSILIKIPHRKDPVRFIVKPTHTIEKVKRRAFKRIKEEKKDSSDDYCLVTGGRELGNKESLEENGIRRDDVLTLEEFKLRIMHWSGQIFDLDDVRRNETIFSLKERILKKKAISIDDQRLSLDGKRLNDENTIEKEQIKHRTILTFSAVPKLLQTRINITVMHWNGDEFNLSPSPNDYIDDVKDAIHDLQNIPLEQIRLSFQGEPTQISCNLKEQGIIDGSVLDLEPMRLLLEFPGRNEPVCINVEMDQRIYDVKKIVANMSNLSLASICIMSGSEELDSSKTISDYEIHHDDTLEVEMYQVKVMHFFGEVFSIDKVNAASTPRDVKEQLSTLMSFDIDEQVLCLNGMALNDMLSLCHQGVRHKSVLIL
eukprot:jgi/Psemu1/226071/e_gw1.1720.2.1